MSAEGDCRFTFLARQKFAILTMRIDDHQHLGGVSVKSMAPTEKQEGYIVITRLRYAYLSLVI